MYQLTYPGDNKPLTYIHNNKDPSSNTNILVCCNRSHNFRLTRLPLYDKYLKEDLVKPGGGAQVKVLAPKEFGGWG